jgi:hypothetical protein
MSLHHVKRIEESASADVPRIFQQYNSGRLFTTANTEPWWQAWNLGRRWRLLWRHTKRYISTYRRCQDNWRLYCVKPENKLNSSKRLTRLLHHVVMIQHMPTDECCHLLHKSILQPFNHQTHTVLTVFYIGINQTLWISVRDMQNEIITLKKGHQLFKLQQSSVKN